MKKLFKEMFHWPKDLKLNIKQIITAVFGMSVPVIAGIYMDYPHLGIFASFGGLLLNTGRISNQFGENIKDTVFAMFSGGLAFFIGSQISNTPLMKFIILPGIVFVVSFAGGINRSFARLSTLFLLFLSISLSLDSTKISALAQIILFFAGGIWTLFLTIILWPIFKKKTDAIKKPSTYTFKQQLKYWIKSLKRFKNWQYSLRISLCSAFAVILIYFIPMQHSFWILLTVIIVLERGIENLPKRISQRGLGTLCGVMILGALVNFIPVVWISILLISVLAGIRVYLGKGNYLIYSFIMTMIMMILIDFGTKLSLETIIVRLIATIIACGISFIFGYLIWIKYLRLNNHKDQIV